MTFMYQCHRLCFPGEGRRDLRVGSVFSPGSVHPGPWCGGQGGDARAKAAGTCWTVCDSGRCEVTMLLSGSGAWGRAGGVSHHRTRGGAGTPLRCVLGRNDTRGPHCVTPVVQGWGDRATTPQWAPPHQTLIPPMLSVAVRVLVSWAGRLCPLGPRADFRVL